MLIFGHRGAAYDAPENTLAAIREGINQCADGVEIDVRLTRDKKVAVIHDETLLRTASFKGKVSDTHYDFIRKLDAGSWKSVKYSSEYVPLLEEALDALPSGKVIQIELKDDIKSVPYVAEVIMRGSKPLSEIIIIGFSYNGLKMMKSLLPGVKVLWINGEKSWRMRKMPPVDKLIAKLKAGGLDGVDFDSRFDIGEVYVESLSRAGLYAYSWTVDNPERAGFFSSIGVAGIATNRPAYIRGNSTLIKFS